MVSISWLYWSHASRGAQSQSGTSTAEVDSLLEQVAIPETAPPQPEVGVDDDQYLDKTPVRQTKGLDLTKMGWTYDCRECHRMIKSKWNYDREMTEHMDIVLDHGNNRFCLNCHHETNRNAFADYDGSVIPETDVVLLCAKCHGPTYQDWKAGVHGRSNGYWDTTKGPQTRLRCIQCHDPHSPAFPGMKPDAAPTYPKRAAGKQVIHGEKEAHADSGEGSE